MLCLLAFQVSAVSYMDAISVSAGVIRSLHNAEYLNFTASQVCNSKIGLFTTWQDGSP